jgi:AcrR family transcriptional regulator
MDDATSPPDSAGGESLRRSEATRSAILAGALQVFARSGFEAASTRTIATEAGVHHALLRYHFANKEELWRAAITAMFERQGEEFAALHAAQRIDPTTTEGMKEMVRRYVRYCAAHPEHAAILVHEAIADTPRLDWAVDQFIRSNVSGFNKGLGEHTAAGRLRVEDPVLAGIILSAASQMVFVLRPHLRRVFHQDVGDPAFVERLADALVTMLFKD